MNEKKASRRICACCKGVYSKTEKIVEGRNYTYRTDIVSRTLGVSRKATLEDKTE